MISAWEFAGLVVVGGWAALDSASMGQFMISRPLVATVIGGLLVGRPTEAAQLGLVLEVLHLGVLPIGAARFPEAGPAGVVVGAAVAWTSGWPGLLTLVLFALCWEWLGGETTRGLRALNGRFEMHSANSGRALARLHAAALGRDWARGAALVAAGLPLAWIVVQASTSRLAAHGATVQITLSLVVVAGLAATARRFGRERLPFALAGAAATGAALWIA